MKSQSLLSNKKNYFLNWNTDKKKVVLQYFFTNLTSEKIGDESSKILRSWCLFSWKVPEILAWIFLQHLEKMHLSSEISSLINFGLILICTKKGNSI